MGSDPHRPADPAASGDRMVGLNDACIVYSCIAAAAAAAASAAAASAAAAAAAAAAARLGGICPPD